MDLIAVTLFDCSKVLLLVLLQALHLALALLLRKTAADRVSLGQTKRPKSNARTCIPGANCAENAVSCVGFRGVQRPQTRPDSRADQIRMWHRQTGQTEREDAAGKGQAEHTRVPRQTK
eukprot:1916294-Rhodomonas_salina.2